MKFKPLLIVVITTSNLMFSTGASLLLTQSVKMNSMGSIGVSVPTSDIVASYYNPANQILPSGFSYQKTEFKFEHLPYDLQQNYDVITNGYRTDIFNFQVLANKTRAFIDLGEMYGIDEYGNIVGTYRANTMVNTNLYSFAFWLDDYPFYISVGKTHKQVMQTLIDCGTAAESGEVESINNFFDFGCLLSFPFRKVISRNLLMNVNPSVGYSKSNIGGDIYFIDANQWDPSPIYARFGVSNIINLMKNEWKLLELTISREASDLLVNYSGISSERYQNGLGDIEIGNHIFGSKVNGDVIIHRGYELNLLDIYSWRWGTLMEIGYPDLFTRGYGINSAGIVNLISFISNENRIAIINDYFSLKYNHMNELEEFIITASIPEKLFEEPINHMKSKFHKLTSEYGFKAGYGYSNSCNSFYNTNYIPVYHLGFYFTKSINNHLFQFELYYKQDGYQEIDIYESNLRVLTTNFQIPISYKKPLLESLNIFAGTYISYLFNSIVEYDDVETIIFKDDDIFRSTHVGLLFGIEKLLSNFSFDIRCNIGLSDIHQSSTENLHYSNLQFSIGKLLN